ncbi:MAG: cell division protein ZapA [Bacteroidales bacterium]|nr:cell division protein ZapA [Bacteroidales bacterium]
MSDSQNKIKNDKMKITVNIADRPYTMTILKDDEEYVRKAAKYINNELETMAKKYLIKDNQDLLAMFCLQTNNMLVKLQNNINSYDKMTERLLELDNLLEKH